MKASNIRTPAITLATIVIVGMAAAPQQAAQGVGVVNLQRVMPETPGYQTAQATFQTEFQPATEALQAMILRRDSLIAECDRTVANLTPADRETLGAEIQGLVAQIDQGAADLQNQQAARERELMQPLELRVQAVLEGLRAERNFAIIFDVASTSGLAAVDQTIDVTDMVIQRLQ
jgi:Skp family chaperone for outer membrane proteins